MDRGTNSQSKQRAINFNVGSYRNQRFLSSQRSGASLQIGTTGPDHTLHVAGSFNATAAGTSLRVTPAGDVVIRLGIE